ncbi:MAG: short-chain dehydrogenase [Haliea sp.]|nr:short-chain dehydrogenase [Haliea sp.]|tara:strand:+ start:21241 stop:21996 length:756 start_codon:yes stop_codon:yes gene_type:complete
MKRFASKAALVTGAAAGIGKATATRLAAEGADLYLADINREGVEALAAELAKEHGVKAFAGSFDAADAESCKQLVAAAAEALGRLDLVCNIAGIQKWDHFAQITDDTWNRLVAINLNSVFFISREAMPLLEQTRGNIINVASVAGLTGIAYNAAYCASKAGVIGLTRSVAVEYASRGVRCNAIAPGGVKAGQAANPIPEDVDFGLITPLSPKTGDMCEPEEIAAAVAYLGSEEARFVTGSVFTIDGGQLAS